MIDDVKTIGPNGDDTTGKDGDEEEKPEEESKE